MSQGPFFDRRLGLMQIVAALNVALVSALGGRDAARATRRHAEQRRDHVLRENLWELGVCGLRRMNELRCGVARRG
jgi:hypothetical protein